MPVASDEAESCGMSTSTLVAWPTAEAQHVHWILFGDKP